MNLYFVLFVVEKHVEFEAVLEVVEVVAGTVDIVVEYAFTSFIVMLKLLFANAWCSRFNGNAKKWCTKWNFYKQIISHTKKKTKTNFKILWTSV